MNETVLEKIKKLLRLSKSSNRHESELALARAMEIATKHGVDVSTVDSEKESTGPEEDRFTIGKRRAYETKLVDSLLQQFFKIKVVYWDADIRLFGKRDDLELAKWMRGYLVETFRRLQQQAAAEAPEWIPWDKNSYYSGLYSTIKVRLAEAKRIAEAEELAKRARESGQGVYDQFAIVVVNNEKTLAKFVKDQCPRLRQNKIRSGGSFNHLAHIKGQQDGQNVNLGRPITGRTATHQLA